MRRVSVHAITRCALLAALAVLLSLLPSWSIHRGKYSTLPPFQWSHSVLHPSRCSQPIPTIVCFCRSGAGSPIILLWNVGSMVSKIPIPAHLQCCCGTDARTDWLRSNICTNFRCGSFLDTEIPVLNSFLYTQKKIAYQCFVRGPAPNRSVKEFAVELSLWISTFVGIPRSMCIAPNDSPTGPPFTGA